MAPKESAEMRKARKLIIENGLNAKQASKLAGITAQAIYIAPWYQQWKREQEAQKAAQ